jgi:hypothetical protein
MNEDTGLSIDRLKDVLKNPKVTSIFSHKRTPHGLLIWPDTLNLMELFAQTVPQWEAAVRREIEALKAEEWCRAYRKKEADRKEREAAARGRVPSPSPEPPIRTSLWNHEWAETKTRLWATNRNPYSGYPGVKCTYVDRRISMMCGGKLAAAVLLAQSIFWQERAKIVRRGYLWFKKSVRDWVDDLGIPYEVVRANLAWLESQGLIVTYQWPWSVATRRKYKSRPVTHVRVLHKNLFRRLTEIF